MSRCRSLAGGKFFSQDFCGPKPVASKSICGQWRAYRGTTGWRWLWSLEPLEIGAFQRFTNWWGSFNCLCGISSSWHWQRNCEADGACGFSSRWGWGGGVAAEYLLHLHLLSFTVILCNFWKQSTVLYYPRVLRNRTWQQTVESKLVSSQCILSLDPITFRFER